jgi:hypothetical protein
MVKFVSDKSFRVRKIEIFNDMLENWDQSGGWIIVAAYNPLVNGNEIEYRFLCVGVGKFPTPAGLPNLHNVDVFEAYIISNASATLMMRDTSRRTLEDVVVDVVALRPASSSTTVVASIPVEVPNCKKRPVASTTSTPIADAVAAVVARTSTSTGNDSDSNDEPWHPYTQPNSPSAHDECDE